MKIYLASSLDEDKRLATKTAREILESLGFEVYYPLDHFVEHAWEYPNAEWGLMVFQSDVEAIKACDICVFLTHGRNSTAGGNWEAGFAFGIGKKVIVVEMSDEPMSLMVANGRYATVKGLAGLKEYDWDNMPKTRTNTEQK